MKLRDKELKNLARNMRKWCKSDSSIFTCAKSCKYIHYCNKTDKPPCEYNSIKELAEALRSVGI